MMGRAFKLAGAAALTGSLLAASGPARSEIVILRSDQPYWAVGIRDPSLSQACALRRFNVRQPSLYVARFTGRRGAETLNVAKGTGLNLYDPDHRARPNEDYFFRREDSTSCEVFVGGRNAAPAAPGGGKKP